MALYTERQIRNFKAKISLSTSGCIEWNGCKDESGYGRLSINDKGATAHRMSMEMHTGKRIPSGMSVLHHCDNPCCCNPAHLYIGTTKQNIMDRVQRKRSAKGEDHGRAKLGILDVLKIRYLLENKIAQIYIANHFSVSQMTIYKIKNRKMWAWL